MKYFIKNILRFFKLKLKKIHPYNIFDFENFLLRYLKSQNSRKINLVQIGAYDGHLYDPIENILHTNASNLRSYLLEPQIEPYQKLTEKYKSYKDIIPLNYAIHPSKDSFFLHRVDASSINNASSFLNGTGSFSLKHVKKFVGNKKLKLSKIKVKCISINKLMEKYKLNKIDILIIDAEGFDYEILKSINFKKVKPQIIRFEHGIRDSVMSNAKFTEICNILNKHKYQIIAESYDATAFLINRKELIF